MHLQAVKNVIIKSKSVLCYIFQSVSLGVRRYDLRGEETDVVIFVHSVCQYDCKQKFVIDICIIK